ncbi:MAG TPA: CDP-diacylglycerol--serine O-phosphatidyltransferase [Alphaproteobacteria bacterium]|jgi:CDP-diacylglycerol--serine O-phosphatidyltransferase|nr:CDP-diacylglycerol--serine O-phosphatidyltransferase [Alphaproteobacteria bacterium]
MIFRKRRNRPKGQSINMLIPNILTTLALCAGMTAIRFGIQGNWEAAVIALMAAGIFDALDGRIARLLGGTSRFGAELDSLSDFVSFGVAPAVMIYFWTMHAAGGVGWALVLLFSVCCALRLARFNIKAGESDLPPWAFNYFTGLPAPAGAALVILPMLMTFQFGPGIFDLPAVNGAVIVVTAFLEVSRIPTFSFKQFKVPQKFVLPTLLLVGVLAAFLVSAPWATCIAVLLAYVASIPFAVRSFRRLQKAAAEIQAHGLHGAKPETHEADAAE